MLAVAIVAVLCLFPVAYAKLLEQPQGNAQTADAETVRNDQTQQLLGAVSTLRDGAGKCISFKASQIESDLSAEGTGGGLNTLPPCILPLPACVWLYFCTIAIPQRLPGVCDACHVHSKVQVSAPLLVSPKCLSPKCVVVRLVHTGRGS